MTLQWEMWSFFNQIMGRGDPVNVALSRWEIIGAIRKIMGTCGMGLFILATHRNYSLAPRFLHYLEQAINAHVYIVGLPAIISINADEIYRYPVLHDFYMRYPEYAENHEKIRELIAKEEVISKKESFVDAMLDYYNIPELKLKKSWFELHPHELHKAVIDLIYRNVKNKIDNCYYVVDYITSHFIARDPDLIQHVANVKAARALNVLHDADFAMQTSMIYMLHAYRHIFEAIERTDRPRPYLHYGTSRFFKTPQDGERQELIKFIQPLQNEMLIKVEKPLMPTTFAFDHEGVEVSYDFKFYKFGEVIRSAPSPDRGLGGTGGDSNTIWHCDALPDLIYELSTSDFSVIRSAPSPGTGPYDIGGDSNTIWHYDYKTTLIYELSTSDFSVIRWAGSPGAGNRGIGGDSNTIWFCDAITDLIYELSTSDFSVIRSAPSPGTGPYSIGGDSNTIWHTDSKALLIYELSTSDFSVIQSAPSPYRYPAGIGGDANTIWHYDSGVVLIYELGTGK